MTLKSDVTVRKVAVLFAMSRGHSPIQVLKLFVGPTGIVLPNNPYSRGELKKVKSRISKAKVLNYHKIKYNEKFTP